MQSNLHKLVINTPKNPGVYILKNKNNTILYIGKAKNLKNRLSNYVGSSKNLSAKISHLIPQVVDLEFIITNDESDALLLESTLIKKFKPKYNAQLKDDKTYPYIKISLKEKFPQVYVTRKLTDDKAKYFGPFSSAKNLRQTLNLLKRIFPYRSCTKKITGHDAHPCLEYHIKQCLGPCIGKITEKEYKATIQDVINFLEGKTKKLLSTLSLEMKNHSSKLNFERAGQIRDQIKAIKTVTQEQQKRIISPNTPEMDLIGIAREKEQAIIELFFVRNGKLWGTDSISMFTNINDQPNEILTEFVKQFYVNHYVPKKIITQLPIDDSSTINKWINKTQVSTVKTPSNNTEKNLMQLLETNSIQALKLDILKSKLVKEKHTEGLEDIQEYLGLNELPKNIECYDISNFSGKEAVASLVVFKNGHPSKKDYRRFRIKTVIGINDYSMMQEVLHRRFSKFISKPNNTKNHLRKINTELLPDLILIDGGKGHLNASLEVLLQLGLSTNIASIAKKEELLYVPQIPEAIIFPKNSQGLFILQRLRDEAHRFAITYHRKLRSKEFLKSSLDSIPGIGPKRKLLLLKSFKNLDNIKKATIQEITSKTKINLTIVKQIKNHLKNP